MKPFIRAATALERGRAIILDDNEKVYACQRFYEYVLGDPAYSFGNTPRDAYDAFVENEAMSGRDVP